MGEQEDRAALEKQLADMRASIQGRLHRIENKVGSGPKAVWTGVKKHPAPAALAAAAAGLLVGKMIFGKRRRALRETQEPVSAPGGATGGLRYLFWVTVLQTGLGLAADVAANFIAGKSGAEPQTFRENEEEDAA